ncbi:2-dehydro-3-deoxy-L-galactonate aldolase [Edaphobacter aggregans]|uniref:2-dehydro-3-deoxy-L-galactonate aldolase n=1 Tax=Edaphobacter aggregans TaxID=570835 RepID=A0A428MCM0_9BACT|nr:dihydrodipicolinate synthase family protein [Edaphobacter aggregans]RSL14567.1 2-dehydro-3-deoxy-L-galactonate aldolase [Edaphobacter aggregans]
MLLEGLFIPLTTPFYPDGSLNLRKLEHNADRYSKTPAAGLVVLSEQGEPSMLSDEETRKTLLTATENAGAEKVLLAGVSRDSVAGTLELAEYAASVGYDAVLVKQPSVVKNSRELLTYFRAVADRTALPVVLYSPDGLLPVDVVVELAAHAQIIGLLNGGVGERVVQVKAGTAYVRREVTVTTVFAAVTGRMQAQEPAGAGTFISADVLTDGGAALAVAPPKPALKTRTKVVGFQVLGGASAGMLEALQAGAVGVAPGFAACAPQGCYEVFAAWKDGDLALAEEKQVRLRDAITKVETELGTPGIRFGCDLNGYFGGRPRLPLLPITGEQREAIEGLMRGVRN